MHSASSASLARRLELRKTGPGHVIQKDPSIKSILSQIELEARDVRSDKKTNM